jgi:dienelactone hydrolase
MNTIRLSVIALCAFAILSSADAQVALRRGTARAFSDAFASRDWDRLLALMHPEFLGKHKIEEWKTLREELGKQGGDLLRHAFFSLDNKGAYTTIVHRAWFRKDSLDFRMVVDTLNLIDGFWVDMITPTYAFAPPPYAKRSAFREVPVTIGDTGSALPGTLSIPKSRGPHPTVILVHDSGPLDRDATVKGNRPFRDLAWGLASNGISVLRYEKRSRAFPRSLDPKAVTVKEEIVDDVLAAVRMLRARKDVDTARLFVVGHSHGGTVAPEIAVLAPGVKGIALLASAARPLEDVIEEQLLFTAALSDSASGKTHKTLAAQRASLEKLRRHELPESTIVLSAPAHYYYDLQKRSAVKTAKKLAVPMFLAFGGKDYQVTKKDEELWKSALGDKSNVRFYTCENCYHLLIETPAQPGPANYNAEGHVSLDLIRALAQWCRNPSVAGKSDAGRAAGEK